MDTHSGLLPSLPMLTWAEIIELQHDGFILATYLVPIIESDRAGRAISRACPAPKQLIEWNDLVHSVGLV